MRGLAAISQGEQRWRSQAGPIDAPRSFVGLLDVGDVALYDGRLMHCGGANSYCPQAGESASKGIGEATGEGSGEAATASRSHSDRGVAGDADGLRILFYTTFRHADRLADAAAFEDPARRSILSKLAGTHTLHSLRDELRQQQ